MKDSFLTNTQNYNKDCGKIFKCFNCKYPFQTPNFEYKEA